MNPSVKKDRTIYKLANDYLTASLKAIGENHPEEILNCYRKPSPKTCLRDIYQRLLESAQNRQYGAQMELLPLRSVLCNFDPHQVIKKYPNIENYTKLLKDLMQYNILKKSRQTENYCKTIISGATFLTRFDDGKKFTQWASIFDQHPTYEKNPALRAALPALLS